MYFRPSAFGNDLLTISFWELLVLIVRGKACNGALEIRRVWTKSKADGQN